MAEEEDDDSFTCLFGEHGQTLFFQKDKEAVLSRFEFTYPDHFPGLKKAAPVNGYHEDGDGDLLVTRRGATKAEGTVIIEHQQSTSLELVGEQVWRGALFLADYLLHCCQTVSPVAVTGVKVMELAAGVGLTSIVAGMTAQSVLCTDVDRGNILHLIDCNLKHNEELTAATTRVKELDFYDPLNLNKLEDDLKGVTLLLAADVVYNNELTDQFFNTVYRLMSCPPNKTLLVALEKRYVFTIADEDTVAPCYEYFLQCLERLQQHTTPATTVPATLTLKHSKIEWQVEEIDTSFPQYFTYERTRHLVLWKIRATLQ